MTHVMPVTSSDASNAVRVMVVDDSSTVRNLVSQWLGAEAGLEVVARCSSGDEALTTVAQAAPDVVILDIEMPGLSGVETLPQLLAKRPGLVVIVVSTLTRRNAELSLRCLTLGAADCLAKPGNEGPQITSASDFRRDLIARVRTLGQRAKHIRAPLATLAARPAAMPAPTTAPSAPRPVPPVRAGLRPLSRVLPRIVLIGSSTGGPQALATLMEGLKPVLSRVPVLITQHMPVGFTTILAEHISRVTGARAYEPAHGDAVKPGVIYIAPGGQHMRLEGSKTEPTIALSDDPPINYCRPAVDPLFFSVSTIYGPAVLAAVLTGMGSDGAHGAVAVADGGGNVLAQDEATSVVWGMPGAAFHAGACAAVLPLGDMAAHMARIIKGERL